MTSRPATRADVPAETAPTDDALDLLQRERDMYRRLFEVTSDLSSAALPDDVIAVIFARGLEALAADTGFIGLVNDDGTELHVQRFTDIPTASVEHLSLPIDASYPIAATARDGAVRLIESNEQLTCDYPELVRIDAADHACASIPLVANGRVWGAINIGFGVARPFTEVERSLMELIGVQCGIAYERAVRLYQAETRLRDLRALEIHDDVVQDLAVARLALEAGHTDTAMQSLSSGLDAAKRIVSEIATGTGVYRRDLRVATERPADHT